MRLATDDGDIFVCDYCGRPLHGTKWYHIDARGCSAETDLCPDCLAECEQPNQTREQMIEELIRDAEAVYESYLRHSKRRGDYDIYG